MYVALVIVIPLVTLVPPAVFAMTNRGAAWLLSRGIAREYRKLTAKTREIAS
jgi:hypothetical protein